MAGPWEQYQQEAPTSGPWDQYATEDSAMSPAENIGNRIGNLIKGVGLGLKAPFVGAGNWAGLVPDDRVATFKQELAENSGKPGGFGGQVIGGAIPAAGLSFLPGGNTVAGAALYNGLYGAIQPAESGTERAINAGVGAVGGAGGQSLGRGIKAGTQRFLTAAEQKAAAEASRNAARDATIKASIDAGYTFPPATLKPSPLNNVKESISGKYATEYEASARNQELTDRLARRAAGLGEDEAITPANLQSARDRIKKPYQDIAGLGLQKQLDALDAARNNAQAAWKEYDRQGTRAAINDYYKFKNDAANIEQQIEQVLTFKKRPELIDEFRDARRRLAINHDVENALIEGGGSIDARVIGKQTQRGDKLTGDLKTIGDFANNFPRLSRPEKQMGSQGVSKLSAGLGSLLAGGGGATMGPVGIAAGALPFVVPPLMRSRLLSRPVQQGLVPQYAPGFLPLLPSRAARGLPALGAETGLGLLREQP